MACEGRKVQALYITDGCQIHEVHRTYVGLSGKDVQQRLPIKAQPITLATFREMIADAIGVPQSFFTVGMMSLECFITIGMTPFTKACMDSFRYTPGTCELCFSHRSTMTQPFKVLEDGAYGTYDWGKANGDKFIEDEVAWAGENEFCHICFDTESYIWFFAEKLDKRRLALPHKTQAWLQSLESLYDAADGKD